MYMPLLKKRFARNGEVDETDTRMIKKLLNRMGYYTPRAAWGITEIPDDQVFESLKRFQTDYKLSITGEIKPGDETERTLHQSATKPKTGSYIWRTVEDEKVRSDHARYNRTVRQWADSPDPGEEYGCRCWVETLGNTAAARKEAVLGKGKADFTLKPDLDPVSDAPWYASPEHSEVNINETIIAKESKKAEINSDLVRAIIYVETTQGYYDAYYPMNKSIRPMNVQAEYWKDLGYSRDDLDDPRSNIQAGIDLIKRIKKQKPDGTIEEIAILYNDLNAKRINDYGARVARIMKEKPWLQSRP